MMRHWTEILPLFLVRIIARRNGERFLIAGKRMVNPRPGTFFVVEEPVVETVEDQPVTYRR